MLAGLAIASRAPQRHDVDVAASQVRAFRQSPLPAVGQTATRGLQRAVSVGERLQLVLHPWTSFVVVPVFALANAGVDLRDGVLADALSSPLTWGIVLGLVVGKLLGIGLGALLAAAARPRRAAARRRARAGLRRRGAVGHRLHRLAADRPPGLRLAGAAGPGDGRRPAGRRRRHAASAGSSSGWPRPCAASAPRACRCCSPTPSTRCATTSAARSTRRSRSSSTATSSARSAAVRPAWCASCASGSATSCGTSSGTCR